MKEAMIGKSQLGEQMSLGEGSANHAVGEFQIIIATLVHGAGTHAEWGTGERGGLVGEGDDDRLTNRDGKKVNHDGSTTSVSKGCGKKGLFEMGGEDVTVNIGEGKESARIF